MALASLPDLVGATIADTVAPWVEVATADAIRHFARAYGDDNPLYSSRDHAVDGARGELVAPPLFPLATGTPASRPAADTGGPVVELDQVEGARSQSIHHEDWTFRQPIPEGMALVRSRELLRAAREATGWLVTERITYRAGDTVYAVDDRTRQYLLERPAPATFGPQRHRTTYSAEELAKIDAAYDAHARRGPTPRHVDGVRAGDTVGPMVKGPLTTTDLIEYRSGVGPGPLGGEALALAYANRRRRPELYTPDASGVPDIIERRHWDDDYARQLGYPGAYDYSHTRLTWLSHLITDWMGDGGWLLSLSATTALGMNFVGDTHWLDGKVVEVSTTAGADGSGSVGIVTVEVRGTNQLGAVTCKGAAKVLLPVSTATTVSSDTVAAVADMHSRVQASVT